MELRLLEYFLAVAREENINKAAEIIHVSQPTLSRQLAQLEEDVGVQLFIRGNKGVTLTEEGLLLRRRAEEIMELVDKTSAELLQQDLLVVGKLTIGWGEIASVETLAKLLYKFMEKYPAVTLDAVAANADVIKDGIDQGIIDAGLLLEPIDMEKYDYVRLPDKERWVVVLRADDALAKKDRVTAKELAGRKLILPRRLSVQSELASWFGKDFKKLNSRVSSNLSTNCSVMVYSGMGIGIVIEGSLPYLDTNKIVTRPLCPELTAASVFAWKRQQPFGLAAKKLIEFIRENS